jgi:DNA repair protein RecO (recombination protein O)
VSDRQALLLKRTDYREADLVVTLFTTTFGKVQALARGARNSRKRFGGSLEPIHTLDVELDEPKRGDLFELRSATVSVPRLYLSRDLEKLQAAGKVLGWLREALPERHREPQLWDLAVGLLDALESREGLDTDTTLATFGLHFLGVLGWGLDFESCVKCGKVCPPGKSGTVSASRGGLVCTSCGGAKTRLDADSRRRLSETSQGAATLEPNEAGLTLRLVEEALASHANLT